MTRPTEITMVLANKGTERGVIMLLTEAFERIAAMETALKEIAVIQLQSMQQIEKVVDGAGEMRNQVEKIKRRVSGSEDSDLPPTAS